MEKNRGILGAVIALLGVTGYAVFQYLYPGYYPSWYWVIPVFFLVNAVILYAMTSSAKGDKSSIHKPLILKMIKLFGALLLMILYVVLVKQNALSFILSMAVFYLVYTILETKVLLDLNKKNANDEAKKK